MKAADLEFLIGSQGQALVEEHLGDRPEAIALRFGGKGVPAAALASQVKYLQRARKKLPTWFAVRCILPGRAFEQSSSEMAASLKPFITGARALDLTCGLGVDSQALAEHFGQVIALERNAELAAVVRHNLGRLGIANVQVEAQAAEDFLASYTGPRFDLVYLDPDRRDEAGSRKFRLEDCQPDVLALRDRLCAIGHRVMIKVSPMLDLAALRQQLAPIDRLTVLAINNECKEILVELGASDGLRIGVTFQQDGRVHRYETEPREVAAMGQFPEEGDCAYEADVSLYKAGLVGAWWQDQYPGLAGGMNHPGGYYFSPELLDDFPGRVFVIKAIMHYKPPQNRKYIHRAGLRQVNLSRRHFDLPIKTIRAQLHVKEGGTDYLLFTRMPTGERVMLHAQRIDT